MVDFRVWHASRDPYHCIFRLIRLMVAKGEPVHVEQLRILDMFLMFPPLLHRLSLPANIKERFRTLHTPKPDSSFMRLPGTASVWQGLQPYQTAALKHLTGLGFLRCDALSDSYASLDAEMVPEKIMNKVIERNSNSIELVTFLVDGIGSLHLMGREGLIKRAGLPSRGLVI